MEPLDKHNLAVITQHMEDLCNFLQEVKWGHLTKAVNGQLESRYIEHLSPEEMEIILLLLRLKQILGKV